VCVTVLGAVAGSFGVGGGGAEPVNAWTDHIIADGGID
jgi:hypothetical protein